MREMRYFEALSLLESIGSLVATKSGHDGTNMFGIVPLPLQKANNRPKHHASKAAADESLEKVDFVD